MLSFCSVLVSWMNLFMGFKMITLETHEQLHWPLETEKLTKWQTFSENVYCQSQKSKIKRDGL